MKYFKAPAAHRRTIWPWFVVGTTLVIGGAPWLPPPYNSDKMILAGVGGLWALAFYLHSRHAEDARFAKDLMTDFNNRYNQLHSGLQRAIRDQKAFDQETELLVMKYFNLCAEEWLFAKLGYIYEPVWNSWCSGMHEYSKDDRVIALWEKERQGDSYYGFEFPPPKPTKPTRAYWE